MCCKLKDIDIIGFNYYRLDDEISIDFMFWPRKKHNVYLFNLFKAGSEILNLSTIFN
ncbi:15532_t:CDS:2 [Cetraspora pellucida]|uniref:15532_t:CDS:1 n=1 Tax=Cetraspora pellucida TaxID=1433469 RepID=A0A9N9HIH3_9GLOM|nr:15532_t:CDS:2 [Cetraspora pellucida]